MSGSEWPAGLGGPARRGRLPYQLSELSQDLQRAFEPAVSLGARDALRHENGIVVHNLRLVGEHFAAGGVHVDLKPIHVAEGGLVVAEGFDAREVSHALPRAIQQRL